MRQGRASVFGFIDAVTGATEEVRKGESLDGRVVHQKDADGLRRERRRSGEIRLALPIHIEIMELGAIASNAKKAKEVELCCGSFVKLDTKVGEIAHTYRCSIRL